MNIISPYTVLTFLTCLALFAPVRAEQSSTTELRFEVSFPEQVSSTPLTGRMFLIISRDDTREPRLQVGRYGPALLGVDFEGITAGETVTIDASTLGWPISNLAELAAGEYYVQAVLSRYTKFDRADGHELWMHNDQWEGQHWNRSPGNVMSMPRKLSLDPSRAITHRFEVDQVIPPIEIPVDNEWVKRIKIRSKILSEFWGQPIYLGATVLLPRGYTQHPNASYPVVYVQGHFSLSSPLRFGNDEALTDSWRSLDTRPRFIAVTLQHPTPYFDDSYAVNSANNGPYGDAIHQELIPEIERQFRAIPSPYARVLTGGSTGGWESFALQVFYPDFYGGTWSFAPDPLDFRNVEGIDVYGDTNAFFKVHAWYQVPTANTRFAPTGEVRLTSRQRNRMELVHGTKGRSGQQLDVWSSVFGPVGDDGYFKPLFDKSTGKMDSTVAQYWKENFDLRHYLETRWSEVGSKLVGKLHLICGQMDNYYLNVGVYHMEEFLENTRDPYYAGSITYGARGSHGYRPYTTDQLLRIMGEHITKNAPPDADTSQWKY